jgi:hypothetical protein
LPAEPAAGPDAERRFARLALLAGLIVHAALLAPILVQPLWLDETATRWLIDGGFGEIGARARAWPTQSVAHGFVARAALELLPAGRPIPEIVLRLPSVAAWALALALLHRLARARLGAIGAAAVVLSALGSTNLLECAAQARPYAFGVLGLVASWTGLAEWSAGRRSRGLVLWALGAVLAAWMHFTLLPGLAAQLPLLARAARSASRAERTRLALAALVALALVAPLAAPFARVAAAGAALSFAERPNPEAVFLVLAPGGIGFVLLAAALAGAATPARAVESRPALPAAWRPLDAAALWLLPAALALGLAHGFGVQVFFPRYLLATLLGAALVAGLAVDRMEPRAARLTLALLVLAVLASPRFGSWPRLDPSDWRAAARRIRAEVAAPGEPVLSITPYVESRSAAHLADLEPGGMLMSMYLAYPVPARVHGLPSVCDELGRTRLETLWRELGLDRRPRTLALVRPGDRYDRCLRDLAPGHRQVPLAVWGRLQLLALERSAR